ncbi:phage tail protein [Photorhabdus temperata]|uniref:Phage-related protein n=1 Tax=Photorhabdus temperata subsp. temperata Meg1 TaxID=1393735 RepID=A0A081RS51_PHOTE|nr:phage tail protein [Photorhabdus temperata]KER01504.1 phage-related protein [Photorhabdus temperata subsp. temperata Meg1]MCT8349525.1 phage tail protein [Photorhabdus temperata]
MAIDEFKWRSQVQNSPTGEFAHNVRKVQFGDGYSQVAENGINSESQKWPFTYTGHKDEVIPIFNFIRQHTAKSFIWTPPFGQKGLYRVDASSITMIPLSHTVITINATFEQAFSA